MNVDIISSNYKNYSRIIAGGFDSDNKRIDIFEGELLYYVDNELKTPTNLSNELFVYNTQLDELERRLTLLSSSNSYGLTKLACIIVPYKGTYNNELLSGVMIYIFIPIVANYSYNGGDKIYQEFPNSSMINNGYTNIYITDNLDRVAINLSPESSAVWNNRLSRYKDKYIRSINDDSINFYNINELKFNRVVSMFIVGEESAVNGAHYLVHNSISYFEHDGLVAKIFNELRTGTTPSGGLIETSTSSNKFIQYNGNIIFNDYSKYFLGNPIEISQEDL